MDPFNDSQSYESESESKVGGDLTGLAVPLVLLGSHLMVPSKKTTKCILNNFRNIRSSIKRGGDSKYDSESDSNGKLLNLNQFSKNTGGKGILTDIALPTILMTANHLYKKGRKTNKKFYRPKRYSRRR